MDDLESLTVSPFCPVIDIVHSWPQSKRVHLYLYISLFEFYKDDNPSFLSYSVATTHSTTCDQYFLFIAHPHMFLYISWLVAVEYFNINRGIGKHEI